jgi:membrane-associated phospholipid phosphatase
VHTIRAALAGLFEVITLRLVFRLLAGAVVIAVVVAGLSWMVVLSPLHVTDGLDRPALEAVTTVRHDTLTAVAQALVHLASPEFAGIGTVVLVLEVGLRRRRWDVVVLLGATVWGGFTISVLLKFLTMRDRPEDGLALVDAIGPAFPSGHVIRAVALYGVLAWLVSGHLRGPVRVIPWLVAGGIVGTMGLGRVYLGAHWVTDVIAAVLISAIWTVYAVRTLRHEWDATASRHVAASSQAPPDEPPRSSRNS